MSLARLRSKEVSPRRFVQLATASLLSLYLVVTSGAVVRLTASGLGCDNWPRCGDKPYPEKGGHALIEFGNRIVALVGIALTLVTWLAARRVRSLPLAVQWTALAAFAGTLAQVPLGGITVILELHPIAVMSHFLLALVVLSLAIVVAIEAWSFARGLAPPAVRTWLLRAATVPVVACAVLIVTGAIATASGPHSGGEDIRRLGIPVNDAVYVHVRASAVYGIGFVALGWLLVRRLRRTYPGLVLAGITLLAVLLVQMAVGEIQYRNALPWGLVVVHVALGATIWSLTVGIAYALWRPPVSVTRSAVLAVRQ